MKMTDEIHFPHVDPKRMDCLCDVTGNARKETLIQWLRDVIA